MNKHIIRTTDGFPIVHVSMESRLAVAAQHAQMLAALEEVREFWMGGDCPAELWNNITVAIAAAKVQA